MTNTTWQSLKPELQSVLRCVGVEGEWLEFGQDKNGLYFVRAGESTAAARFTQLPLSATHPTPDRGYVYVMDTPESVNSVHEGEVTWTTQIFERDFPYFLRKVALNFAGTNITRYLRDRRL